MNSWLSKTVELICVFATFVAPATASSASQLEHSESRSVTKVELSAALDNWRRQESMSAAAEQKGLIDSAKHSSQVSSQLSLGGPGLDGGGGVGVMTAQGQLRFLDLAVADRTPLIRFDRETYRKIMTSRGNFVSNKGTSVSNEEFFSCAAAKLSRQDNVLLQYLKPENLRLTVVLTDMPLNRGSLHLSRVVLPSPFGTGYAWDVTQLSASDLYSSTLPADYQKPIASYAVQPPIAASLPQQVLLVNSQMYRALSAQDRCALQVHEILRYIGNFGKLWPRGIAFLLKRSLSTQEIEYLTRKVLAGQTVLLGEIPATNFYKYLAVNGSDHFDEESLKRMESTLYSPNDDNQLSPDEANSVYEMNMLSLQMQVVHEASMMQLGRNYGGLKRILIEQDKKLAGQKFDLRDLIH